MSAMKEIYTQAMEELLSQNGHEPSPQEIQIKANQMLDDMRAYFAEQDEFDFEAWFALEEEKQFLKDMIGGE